MMSIDVLPSCSAPSSLLFDQFSAADAAIASSADASTSSSQSSSPSSSPSSGVHQHHHQSPPSPPPGRAHRNNNKAKYGADAANSADFRFIQNAVAMAILARLHRCCCQLFWLTIVCLIGAVKDANNNSNNQREGGGSGGGEQQAANAMEQQQQKTRATTFQEVRKSVVQQQAGQRRACKTLHELEMQLLRHLTCPQTAVLRPLRSAQHHKKRHFLSRPPSPQLFDISEEMNE